MKSPADLTDESIAFINAAAGVGIDFITNSPGDPSVPPKLHQIFLDIQKELDPSDPEPDSTEPAPETVRPDVLCSQCYVLYHNNPPLYAKCLANCT